MRNKNANCYYIAYCHKYVQWAYYNFPHTFNWYLTTQMSINDKQKMAGQLVGKFLLNLFVYLFDLQNYQIFLSHLSKRNHFGIESFAYQPLKPAFLLNTRKTCSNLELFSIFSQTFFGTNFPDQNKNKYYWNKSPWSSR